MTLSVNMLQSKGAAKRILAMKKTTETNYMNLSGSMGGSALAALAEQMSRHVTACGVTVSADECAHVLSAMASHRLLYIEGNGEGDGSLLLANAIASFLGCDDSATVCTEETEDLAVLMDGNRVASPLSDKLHAIIGTGRLGAVVIDNRAGADISRVFSGLDGYFSDENETYEVRYNDQTLILPKNTYFILVMPEGKARTLIGSELSFFACPIICEMLVTLVTDEAATEPTDMDAEYFYELCREAYLRCQPSEDDWCRIDRIDSFLDARLGRGFGNDGYLTMEKYFSVFSACTGNTSVAIDALVCDHVKACSASLSCEDAKAFGVLLGSITDELKLPRTESTVAALAR